MTWLIMLAYLGLQLGIGLWVARRVRSEADYLVAGRRLGLPLVTVSMFATWFGAETCMGASGAVYVEGLAGGRADPLGYGACLLLSGLVLARPLWRRAHLTLGDLYRERYGAWVERVAVAVMLPTSVFWAAAQIRAFGQVVAFGTELPVDWAIALSALFVVVYTASGGLLADVLTDLVQGGIVAVGLVVLLVLSCVELGGAGELVRAIDPERLSLVAPGESWLSQLDRWMVPVLGSLVAQELCSRMASARSGEIARRASFCAAALYLVVGGVPVVLGLLGPSLVPSIEDPEQFLPALASKVLSPVPFALLSGALMSAILSTIDSVLLAIGALASHNWVLPVLGLSSERARLRSARICVLLGALLAFALALYSEGIYELIESASTFGTAGILVITLMGLHGKSGGAGAALAALGVGLVTTPLAEHGLGLEAPFVSAILAAGAAFLGVAWIERRLLGGVWARTGRAASEEIGAAVGASDASSSNHA